jgi:toxin ParE1/3/4
MPLVRRAPRAAEDLEEVWLFIAQANPTAADKILDQLEHSIELLRENPLIGPAPPEIARDWLSLL